MHAIWLFVVKLLGAILMGVALLVFAFPGKTPPKPRSIFWTFVLGLWMWTSGSW